VSEWIFPKSTVLRDRDVSHLKFILSTLNCMSARDQTCAGHHHADSFKKRHITFVENSGPVLAAYEEQGLVRSCPISVDMLLYYSMTSMECIVVTGARCTCFVLLERWFYFSVLFHSFSPCVLTRTHTDINKTFGINPFVPINI
jgi:hypothetical protein